MNTQKHKQLFSNSGFRTFQRQAGVTLIEAMISLSLSMIVTSAMVVLMANSLGTSTRIIQMSQLSDELRNAMSMMTRDVRRANYSANSIFCYGNSSCGFAGGDAEQAGDIQISGECFSFTLDRGFNGDATDDAVGAFRRVTSGGTGVIEMWTGPAGTTPNCAAAPSDTDPWIELTDSSTVNITVFTIDDAGSTESEVAESKDKTFNNRQREIQISLQGQLILEEAMGNVVVLRRLEDTIYVRNDYIEPPVI